MASTTGTDAPGAPKAEFKDRFKAAQEAAGSGGVTAEVDNGDVNTVFPIKFAKYQEPLDANRDDVPAMEAIDTENRRRYDANESYVPVINRLFVRMRLPPYRQPQPPNYTEPARTKWLARIHDPSFKTIEAIRWLVQRGKVLGADFTLETASAEADRLCIEDWLALKRAEYAKGAYIDFRSLVPENMAHHKSCQCNYRWDGFSPQCNRASKSPIRLTWRAMEGHHFLNPKFEVMRY